MNDKELLKAFEMLKDNCKPENCNVKKCPFAYKDHVTHCKLGSNEQMYPSNWGTANKEYD